MNHNLLQDLVKFQLRTKNDLPKFQIGDEIKVHWLNKIGKKQRIEIFSGLVIVKKGVFNMKSFTVRKVFAGVGVEKQFFLHSPLLQKIEIIKYGKVRRARLFYIRQLHGRLARIKKRVLVNKSLASKS